MKKISWEEWKLIISICLFIFGLLTTSIAWLSNLLIVLSYFIAGYEVILKSFKNILKGELFDECFLMTLATIGAFLIGEIIEATTVMVLFQVGEYLEEKAISKSRDSISKLMELKCDTAFIKKEKEQILMPLENVKVNDIMIVKPGERVPLDGIVIEGNSLLDMKALSGESIPVAVEVNSMVLSGSINLEGILHIRVQKEMKESTVTKILELVENASDKKTKTEQFMTRFSKIYTPIVVALALFIAVIPTMITHEPNVWIYRAIIFLVLSCPCALVISIPLGFFYGIGECSKVGALVKGSIELEKLGKLQSIAFDKTGTLTEGVFEVIEIQTVIEKQTFIDYICSIEQYSNHPIARSICTLNHSLLEIHSQKEIAGKGVVGYIDNREILIGNKKLFKEKEIVIPNVNSIGTLLFVALDKKYVGYIIISDIIKKNAKESISALRKLNLSYFGVVSGDQSEIVSNVKDSLGLDEGYAELLPTEKVQVVETLMKQNKQPLGFVGDGINDAPVLALSDLGISMGGIGSDAAIEASDIVIMNDNLKTIPMTVMIARKTLSIVKFNIIMAISIKIVVLLLGILGISSIWFAIFADVGVTMLAILNSLRISKSKKSLTF